MATSLDKAPWMEWVERLMGGVSRQRYAATFPPDRYFCLLDELPLHLIPQRFRRVLQEREREPGQLLHLNPECILRQAEDLPDGVEEEFVSDFALQGTIAWVRDPGSGSRIPFWLGPELEGWARRLQAGEGTSSAIPSGIRRTLAGAGILASEKELELQPQEREKIVQEASDQFRQKGYVPLADFIHPLHIAALRRYYRYLIRSGAIRLGDNQSQRRYVAHNDPVARFFHHQITSKLSAVAGEALKPSYVYLASYLSGAELKKHVDREQCEFSITLCLDFSPEPELATPWPIMLDTPNGTVSVYQALGDGLAYRGTQLPHYREALAQGQTSTSIFFHYVSADFAGPLN